MEAGLRRYFRQRRVTVRTDELNDDVLAWVDWDGREVEIVLDPYRGGYIESTVHELMHSVYRRALKAWGALEETLVQGLEAEVMALINHDAERVKWWREAIARKLDQGVD